MESRKTEPPFLLSSKKKNEGIVYKRRVTAETAEAVNSVRRERLWCSDQIIREINWFLKSYLPQPAAYTGHDREAWAGTDDEELRITFDTNLRGRNWELDLRAGDFGELFLPPELVLMELKLAGGAPMWLANLMSENEVFSSSYSKYGSYYKHLIGQAPAYGIYKTEGKRYA